MPPPYFPITSGAVSLLLVLVAALPPVGVYFFRRRWRVKKWHWFVAAPIAILYAVFVFPELIRLAAFRGAISLWFVHAVVVFAVSSLAVFAWLKRQRQSSEGGG